MPLLGGASSWCIPGAGKSPFRPSGGLRTRTSTTAGREAELSAACRISSTSLAMHHSPDPAFLFAAAVTLAKQSKLGANRRGDWNRRDMRLALRAVSGAVGKCTHLYGRRHAISLMRSLAATGSCVGTSAPEPRTALVGLAYRIAAPDARGNVPNADQVAAVLRVLANAGLRGLDVTVGGRGQLRKPGMPADLLRKYEDVLLGAIADSQMSSEQISRVLWGYATLVAPSTVQGRTNAMSRSSARLLSALSDSVALQAHQMCPQSLATTIWGYSKAHHLPQPAAIAALSARILELSVAHHGKDRELHRPPAKLKGRDALQITQAFAGLGCSPEPEVLAALDSTVISASEECVSSSNIRSVAGMLWSHAVFNTLHTANSVPKYFAQLLPLSQDLTLTHHDAAQLHAVFVRAKQLYGTLNQSRLMVDDVAAAAEKIAYVCEGMFRELTLTKRQATIGFSGSIQRVVFDAVAAIDPSALEEYELGKKGGWFTVDAWCPGTNVAVEYDGQTHFAWTKEKGRPAYPRGGKLLKARTLNAAGIKVAYLDYHEVLPLITWNQDELRWVSKCDRLHELVAKRITAASLSL